MSGCIRDNVASFRICFSIKVSGTHSDVVESRHRSLCSCGACRCSSLPLKSTECLFPVSWKKNHLGERELLVQRASTKFRDCPSRKREAHLVSRNTSWETWQVSIHFTIMKLIILKKFRCLLLLREKGCFLLYKAASYVFWYTIVWTSVFSW